MPVHAKRFQARRAQLYDRLGRRLIAVGGIGIIAAVLGIFLFIGKETYPLFVPAEVATAGRFDLAGEDEVLAVGLDPYREVGYAIRAGGVDFFSLADGQPFGRHGNDVLGSSRVVSAYVAPQDGRLVMGLDDGRVLSGEVTFELSYPEGERAIHPALHLDRATQLVSPDERLVALAYRHDDDRRSAITAITSAARLLVVVREQQRGLLGLGRLVEKVWDLTADLPHHPTATVVGGEAQRVLAGTAQGEVVEWRLFGVSGRPELARAFSAAPRGTSVTALEFLLGDISLVVGDGRGGVSTWFKVRETPDAVPTYRLIHHLRSHGAAVVGIAPSNRDKQFVTGDRAGEVALHHATSEQTIWVNQLTEGAVRHLAFAPKADGLLALSAAGEVVDVGLRNPHPETTLGTLFGKVWYEGHDAPDHVWQSTGGTDEFEPKLSLVPLIFGTAKGTLYAMFFALPFAVLAAIYTAEFASPAVRNAVKPIVELMASLPSVILGFLAGLWLAPLLERHVIGVAAMFPLVPFVVVLGAWLWQSLPLKVRGVLPRHAELGAIVAATLGGFIAALYLGPFVEGMLFDGSLRTWLADSPHWRYDQRNCLVIGFAMGFAVIPLIFTICEDALSSVPQSLRAGSLALGANRWQTAVRVVLPMAAPGVFSAAMIGFGRAVGETMIVLMATGNTPIMDWSIFTGMRTISANIAVELPEAPHEGTLYRVLFLSGLLLFLVTFAVNTVAEGVRQRLRRKYSRL